MDLLTDFFDLSKTFERVVVPGSQTGGMIEVDPKFLRKDPLKNKVLEKGTGYAKHYQEQEEKRWREGTNEAILEEAGPSSTNALTDIDDAVSLCTNFHDLDDSQAEELTRVYKQYNFSTKPYTGLPIAAFKDQILQTVNSFPVTIIQGTTGCGKTTQVPQYILDYSHDEGLPCNIVVTQPRRLAAISVARRVCSERNWTLGSLVGYQVGLNVQTSPDTRLTFCTTGVLLQRLVHTRHLNNYTHIILDEVHERNQDMDFILMVVRKLMRTVSDSVKVILMSATMDAHSFAEYFRFMDEKRQINSAPIIDLDKHRRKKSLFNVSTYYLCQLGLLGTLPEVNEDEPGISARAYEIAVLLISEFDRLEQAGNTNVRGAVLVFLPGIQEIEELFNMLTSKGSSQRWWVRPLHSTVTTEEQESVFQSPPTGYRKIILSTNIAESSLTVPDIVYVIDFCLTKEMVCDPATNFSSLQITWASKTNCVQRAGRAGRVCDGRVYRLIPQTLFQKISLLMALRHRGPNGQHSRLHLRRPAQDLFEEQTPEILRCPLDRLVLQTKLLSMGSPTSLLALCPTPPDLSNIENTVLQLKEAGALLPTVRGVYYLDDGDITFLGQVMAKLPVDIRVGKMILLGHIFSVLEECIIIGAALSLKSMFSTPFQERMAAYQSKLTWADSSCSDCIAFLNAFKVWRHNKELGMFAQSRNKEENWARRYFLQLRTLREVATLVAELRGRLRHMNIDTVAGEQLLPWTEHEKPLVLKVVIAGAFYPNYFVRGSQGGQVDEREAVRLVVGRNPYTTVYLQGFPMDQPGQLYARTVKKALAECGKDMKVMFDGTSKVFVQFSRPAQIVKQFEDASSLASDIPGKVCMPVYRAVKLRQLRLPIVIDLLPAKVALERAQSLGLEPSQGHMWKWDQRERAQSTMKPQLPSVDTSYVSLTITHVVDPGHFWAHSTQEDTVDVLRSIFYKLNLQSANDLRPLEMPPVVGKLYAAPYDDEGQGIKYYRARVDSTRTRKDGTPMVQVFFVDYGNRADVNVTDLRDFTRDLQEMRELAPQAFECVLCEVRPSLVLNARGLWTIEAFREFSHIIRDRFFFGKVYSVVHGIVSLELISQAPLVKPQRNEEPIKSVNKYLMQKGYAEFAEESYLSKINHEIREQVNNSINMECGERLVYDELQDEFLESLSHNGPDPDPPAPSECCTTITLKGPYSPLEMKVFNLTQVGISRSVQVEWNSVNSVLLDTDPQDPHERLLVAAVVGENAERDRLTVRHTTLMPNIHGLPALIYMIFCPSMELRINADGTRYTGALCGLGADPDNGLSYFPDHDMEVTFDSEITVDDVLDVNRLRFWMSLSLYTDSDQDLPFSCPDDVVNAQGKIQEFIRKLLQRRRSPVELQLFNNAYEWGHVPQDLLLNPSEAIENERGVFRLHHGVQLQEAPQTTLAEQIKQLHIIAAEEKPHSGEITCVVCHVTLPNPKVLRVHLTSSQHQEKEFDITRNSDI